MVYYFLRYRISIHLGDMMTKVTIVPVQPAAIASGYCAISDSIQSFGDTPGQALDALTSQLGEIDSDLLIIVQNQKPDDFFTAKQQERLALLMAQWRSARDENQPAQFDGQAELESLVEAELLASASRAKSLRNEIEN